MTVKVWYPSDRRSDPEPYFLKAEADFVTKYLQFPLMYKDLKTNGGRDLPVSSKENRYPVLIFSHGWGEHYSQNTILMEELASHGYIVFSIAHHYECKFTSFPDGRLIYLELDNPRFQKIMKEQMSAFARGHFEKLKKAASDEEREQVFQEMIATLPEEPEDASLIEIFEEWGFIEAKEILRIVKGRISTIEQFVKHVR